QEYLVSDRIRHGSAKQYSMQEVECHNAIARGSLKYLIQFQQPLSKETFKASTLARYTAKFWSSHLQKTGDKIEQASQLIMSLIAIEKPAYLNWIRLHDPDRTWEGPNLEKSLDSVPMPLYYAAMLGFSTITRLLLDAGADVNAQGGRYGNALQAASDGGHEQVVKTLLDAGADVNAQGGYFGNALQAASFRGHKQVVKMLLDAGADVNAQGGEYGNALQAASYFGESAVLKLLVLKHDFTQLQDPYDRTLLWWAAAGGHSKTVQVLVNQHNYDPQIPDKFGRTPCEIATRKGHT
ncbi:fibronectin type 3 and ankyrin repeat domain protein 1, partial [Pyrenophora tritici-repentis]